MRTNIGKTWKTWKDKNMKKGYTREKNCQEGLWQENYLGSWIKDTTKNIGADWKETEDNGRVNNQEREK